MSHSNDAVKAKPIDKRFLKRLPEFHQPRDFVRASTSNQNEFYKGNDISSQNEKKINVDDKTLTEEEKNKFAAKILRAEMLGNTELVEQLRQQLNAASSTTKTLPSSERCEGGVNSDDSNEATSSSMQSKTILLTKTDFRSGLTYPVFEKHSANNNAEGWARKKHKGSDNKMPAQDFSIKDMLEMEKFTSAEDQMAMFGASVSKALSAQKTDDDFTVDDAVAEQVTKKQKSKKHKFEQQSDFNQAVKAHKKLEQTLENCTLCIDSRRLQKQLIVAIGLKTYLTIPAHQPLVDFQCCIVPMSHVSSCVQMDEDVYDEMKIWRKGIVAMFRRENLDVIFIETAKNVKHQPHAFVDCLPVPINVGDTAPMFFKKAILECEEEWAQNKKIIDLSKKDLKRSIPRGFAYFVVDFGLQNGYAHVIENERKFAANFGQEILGGMLDLDPNFWRRPNRQTLEQQTARLDHLKSLWAPFDWTERVKQRLRDE